jgi:co-chaperonin GroES (HSP10)|tara:strand:- start:511 stop:768 length:258 start_codon:yes stop_codon:yes gene_type:complete
MKAIGKFIVIKAIEEELKTKSGLLLSAEDASGFRYRKGTVLTPGSDVSVIKKNDVIYYDRNAGHDMLLGEESVSIIQERDVVVVL